MNDKILVVYSTVYTTSVYQLLLYYCFCQHFISNKNWLAPFISPKSFSNIISSIFVVRIDKLHVALHLVEAYCFRILRYFTEKNQKCRLRLGNLDTLSFFDLKQSKTVWSTVQNTINSAFRSASYCFLFSFFFCSPKVVSII